MASLASLPTCCQWVSKLPTRDAAAKCLLADKTPPAENHCYGAKAPEEGAAAAKSEAAYSAPGRRAALRWLVFARGVRNISDDVPDTTEHEG